MDVRVAGAEGGGHVLPARGVCAWPGVARPGAGHSVVPAGPVLLVGVRLGLDQGAQGSLRLRGGSGAPSGWPPQQQPQHELQQQPQQQQTPSGEGGGPQEFPGFEHGFVDNGVSYAEQFAAQLRERRRMGM
jgi:hypothetical protein